MTEKQNILTAQAETADEKRKRIQRERKAKSRQRQREEKEAKATNGESISDMWARFSRQLLEDDPKLYEKLQTRHDEVEALEAEVDEIGRGVQRGLRAETLSALTSDPGQIFPMPDVAYVDAKADATMNGTLNYGAIERAETFRPVPGEKYKASTDGVTEYRYFGFRTRLHAETLQRSRESLVLYALQIRDTILDWAVVEQAIAECTSYNSFSPNSERLKKLIREYRGLPPDESAWVILTATDGFQQIVPRSIADEYAQKKIKFLSPAQLGQYLEGRQILESHIGEAFQSPHARTSPTASEIRAAADLLLRANEEKK